jgi:hypothetical protein
MKTSGLEIYREKVKNGEIIPTAKEKPVSVRRRIDVEAVLKHTPPIWKARYEKVLNGDPSRALAVEVKCAECVGFEDVVNRVTDCTCERCPLWAFRPFRGES